MPTQEHLIEFDFEETVIDLDAAVADAYTWLPTKPGLVVGAYVRYKEATDAAIAAPGVVSIDHTPSGGSRTEQGTYTAQVSKAINEEEDFTSFTQFQYRDGDTVILEHKTQQTATETGTLIVVLRIRPIPDGTY